MPTSVTVIFKMTVTTAALNAAEEARKVHNWVIGQQIKQAREAAQPKAPPLVGSELEQEESAWLKKKAQEDKKTAEGR